jgi:hypothetical protein
MMTAISGIAFQAQSIAAGADERAVLVESKFKMSSSSISVCRGHAQSQQSPPEVRTFMCQLI